MYKIKIAPKINSNYNNKIHKISCNKYHHYKITTAIIHLHLLNNSVKLIIILIQIEILLQVRLNITSKQMKYQWLIILLIKSSNILIKLNKSENMMSKVTLIILKKSFFLNFSIYY